jgi:phosphate transport system permease protein
MIALCVLALATSLIPLFSILTSILLNGIGLLNPSFFTQLPAAVGESGGGIANAIQGTLILMAFASLIGVPIGIITGIYLSEYRESRLASVVRFFTDVLTEFPSIVIGIFAYTVIVLYFRSFSVIAGAFALSIIMLPIVTRTTEEAVRLVPNNIREAGIALGLPRWKTTTRIVVPAARSGIVTGTMLSLARAAGETAPLLLTAFNSFYWFSGITKPVASLPMYIFIFSISPFPDWRAKAWGAAFVLILIILSLSIIVRTATKGKFASRI